MDVSQGPGWWQASDGMWYPPELHPDVTGESQDDDDEETEGADEGEWAEEEQEEPAGAWAATADPAVGDQAQPQGSKTKTTLVSLGLALVIIAAIGGIGYFVLHKASNNNNSPQSVASSAVADYQASNLAGLCGLVIPSQQQACTSGLSQLSNYKITTRNLAVGNQTRNSSGNEAVIVVTGTLCVSQGGSPPQCSSNSDPSVDLDRGLTFDQVYGEATNGAASQSADFTLPLTLQNGKWYISVPIA